MQSDIAIDRIHIALATDVGNRRAAGNPSNQEPETSCISKSPSNLAVGLADPILATSYQRSSVPWGLNISSGPAAPKCMKAAAT